MKKDELMGNYGDIERFLRSDAMDQADHVDTAELKIAMAEMAPLLAREAAVLRRRRRNRREAAIMAAVMVPVIMFMLLGASALYYGYDSLVKNLISIAGVLSLMSLATLPLIEKFLPERG